MNKINKKKLTIFILCIILTIGIVLLFFTNILYKNDKSNENVINSPKEDSFKSNLEMDFMLAELLKKEDEIVITEDNTDKTKEIIKRANLKGGIFVLEPSREKFLKIVNEGTENLYTIDNNGYLQKPMKLAKESDLTKKINSYIDSDKTLIIKITDTYKGLVDDMQLDIMIEDDSYAEVFDYNNKIRIALINPERINEGSEDITEKEIFEEIILQL